MFRFYGMWASVVFVAILGLTSANVSENSPLEHFRTFQECISNISSNSGALGCSKSEDCLRTLFNASEQFLEFNVELVKLKIQHSLDSLKHRCSAMFTEALKNNVLCQTEQIASCLKDAETTKSDMCGQIKNMSDCLRPINAKCYNRIFTSILRSIATGIWDNHKCMSTMMVNIDEIWIQGENETLEIVELEDALARSLEHNSSHSNFSSPKSRQGIPVTSVNEMSLENVTTEAHTTRHPNSAESRHCNHILLLLPIVTFLIL